MLPINNLISSGYRVFAAVLAISAGMAFCFPLDLAGLTVTPHLRAESMRYSREPEPAVGARVQLFILNNTTPDSKPVGLDAQTRLLFNNKSPVDLLADNTWAWHDTPAATPDENQILPPGALTVWTFNGRMQPFGPGGRIKVEIGPADNPWILKEVIIEKPTCWLSAVTFLGPEYAIQPDIMVVHIANASDTSVWIESCRIWLPNDRKAPRVQTPQETLGSIECFNNQVVIQAGDCGGFFLRTGPLPLTYAVVEVVMRDSRKESFSLWGHLRIKPEHFDISGGWVNDENNSLSNEIFLKTLKRLHVNTAHIANTQGYTDTPLYDRYPLKYFNKLMPFDVYDTDAMLPRIHAVEFLGEPQYGGGHPVPPQEVWERLHPYVTTRLATTLTHSEERIWRDYAGLSDFPHYDAYRVTAPSPDAWRKYDRWGDHHIRWGAPLETIGDMCRSLRELNRPMPCAIWSQGPHAGWDVFGGRKRTSPTPDEIRVQAYHAVSSRITSLYWFNLSLASLVKWRDTLDELGRIGRELRMLQEFLLEGDAYRHEQLTDSQGNPDWDIASVCGPRAALLFALDLRYEPDPDAKVFRFGPPRQALWRFPLPAYLEQVVDVFGVNAEGTHDVNWSHYQGGIEILDRAERAVIYVASPKADIRVNIDALHQKLIDAEAALGFDPVRNDADFAALVKLAELK
jgi:hypothetical protein